MAPDELAPLLIQRTEVTDRAVRAESWQSLASNHGTAARMLENGRIVEFTADALDDRILGACSPSWRDCRHVIGTVMADVYIPDRFLGWRIRALIAAGLLVDRGAGPYGPGELAVSPT